MDATRPADIMRDEARALWQQALASDAGMARVWLDLSKLDLQNDRPREAADNAERGRKVAPSWWPAQLAWPRLCAGKGSNSPPTRHWPRAWRSSSGASAGAP